MMTHCHPQDRQQGHPSATWAAAGDSTRQTSPRTSVSSSCRVRTTEVLPPAQGSLLQRQPAWHADMSCDSDCCCLLLLAAADAATVIIALDTMQWT